KDDQVVQPRALVAQEVFLPPLLVEHRGDQSRLAAAAAAAYSVRPATREPAVLAVVGGQHHIVIFHVGYLAPGEDELAPLLRLLRVGGIGLPRRPAVLLPLPDSLRNLLVATPLPLAAPLSAQLGSLERYADSLFVAAVLASKELQSTVHCRRPVLAVVAQ